jgi:DNA-binding protein HU-beta
MPAKRTTHRTRSGSKAYAKRGKQGRFKDIQSYKRAHGQDVKRRAKSERSGKKAAI